MKNLLLFFWQNAPDDIKPIENRTALYIAIIGILGTIAGAAIKSLVDYLANRRKSRSDIDLSISTIKKNENEIIANLQEKFLSTQRLLMEMQENLDKWIKRYEKISEEASLVEDEFRIVRRACDDCISGRKDYYQFCITLNTFMNVIEPILTQVNHDDSITILRDLKNLKIEMNELQLEFEKDHPVIPIP